MIEQAKHHDAAGWLMVMERHALKPLGAVRLWQDIEVFLPDQADCSFYEGRLLNGQHDLGELLLLRGQHESGQQTQIRSLPALARYQVSSGGMLIREGEHVPAGNMPVAAQLKRQSDQQPNLQLDQWLPLSAWMKPVLPIAQLAAPFQTMPLAFASDKRDGMRGDITGPNLMLTTIEHLSDFVFSRDMMNPMRLKAALFTISLPSGLAVVRLNSQWLARLTRKSPDPKLGDMLRSQPPLPSVQGRYFYLEDGVALPVGKSFAHGLSRKMVAERIGLKSGGAADIAVFQAPLVYHRVAESDFVPLKRSTIRSAITRLRESGVT